MNARVLAEPVKVRLQAHYAFVRLPFRKTMGYDEMFDSRSQRDLFHGLMLWSDIHGMGLVTGPSGAGKSITVRRFVRSLDEARFRVVYLSHARSTLTGFLRSVNRALDLPMRQHSSDLFDQAHDFLTANGPDRGPHPVLVLDDAEAMSPELFDVLRRLTNYALDAEDRFSVLITGTEAVLRTLKNPALEPFNTRLGFVHTLRGFNLEDTRNYVAFQLRQAGARDQLFAEGAIKKLFQASNGIPRRINQLALHVLIQGAVLGIDSITSEFMTQQLHNHPLYDPSTGA
jgi:general secretion pathway protein A